MILYVSIIVYILSLVIGLFVMASVKTISTKKFLIFFSAHLVFLILFIFTKTTSVKIISAPESNFPFLFFICSGVMLAGLAWRSTLHLSVKLYCSAFSLTILLFLFSPSRLMVFLLSGKYTETLGSIFPVKDRYFLEQQNSSATAFPAYKLIQKHGLFHEVIARDIRFKGKLDSIRIIDFIPGEKAMIRGYSCNVTYVSSDVDSSDQEVKLVKEKQNQIERKL